VGQSRLGIIPVDGTSSPAQPSADIAASLERLFRRHDRWLRGALRKRYGADLVDDLAQETFLKAAPSDVAGAIRHPKAFLLQVAANLVRDRVRKTRREVAEDAPQNALHARFAAPSQDAALTLKQIVLALPVELRDVFVLNHIQGLTYQEIARLRGIPVTTVQHRMRQALVKTAAAMRD
jgi:RNA polymerase sigma factor (sigma-70 family)